MKLKLKPNLTDEEKKQEAVMRRRLGPVDPSRRARQLAAEARKEKEKHGK